MLANYLKKVINEEGYTNKQRLEQTDDFEIVCDGMDEYSFRYRISEDLNDKLAWSEPLEKLINWYNERN